MHSSDFSRRKFVGTGIAAAAVVSTPISASAAVSEQQAFNLINQVVGVVLGIINSGQSESAMLANFEKVFRDYADVPTIAAYCLGAPWRTASDGQKQAYTAAFQKYISRKYGRQFRSFQGASIEIIRGRDAGKLGMLVETRVSVPRKAPFAVEWNVSDRSGRLKFVNLIIEGISLLATERGEIGAIYERVGRDMGQLTAQLQNS